MQSKINSRDWNFTFIFRSVDRSIEVPDLSSYDFVEFCFSFEKQKYIFTCNESLAIIVIMYWQLDLPTKLIQSKIKIR